MSEPANNPGTSDSELSAEEKKALETQTEWNLYQKQLAEQMWGKAQGFFNDAAAYKTQADAAMNDYKTNLDAAIANNTNLNNQANTTLQNAANNLAQRGQAAIQDAYGSSTQDYFNRTMDAGNQQGNLFGTSAGAQANVAAQDASRQAGLSKSAAAMVGAGKGAEAATAGYLTGFQGGQQSYQNAADSRFGANLGTMGQDYTAQQNVAQGMRDTGQAGLNNSNAMGQYAGNKVNQYAGTLGAAQNTAVAAVADGGVITQHGVFNLDKIQYKPNKEKK